MSAGAQLPFPDRWRAAGVGLAIYVRLPDGSEPMYLSMPRGGVPLGPADVDGAMRFLGVIAAAIAAANPGAPAP